MFALLLTAWGDGVLQVGVGGYQCCFVAWGIILIGITTPLSLYHGHFRSFDLPCCGFFPLQSRVDSFHSANQCRRVRFALEWMSLRLAVRIDGRQCWPEAFWVGWWPVLLCGCLD